MPEVIISDHGGARSVLQWMQTGLIHIRKSGLNTFIRNVNKNAENFSEEYVAKRIDEARFLRAYFYSELFMLIGGMSIITEPQDRATMTEDELLCTQKQLRRNL